MIGGQFLAAAGAGDKMGARALLVMGVQERRIEQGQQSTDGSALR
jgi:hypothetical protein